VDRLKAIPAEKRTWRVQQEIKAFQLAEQADVSSGVVARTAAAWQKTCASSHVPSTSRVESKKASTTRLPDLREVFLCCMPGVRDWPWFASPCHSVFTSPPSASQLVIDALAKADEVLACFLWSIYGPYACFGAVLAI
jgi:hypothetical protein